MPTALSKEPFASSGIAVSPRALASACSTFPVRNSTSDGFSLTPLLSAVSMPLASELLGSTARARSISATRGSAADVSATGVGAVSGVGAASGVGAVSDVGAAGAATGCTRPEFLSS